MTGGIDKLEAEAVDYIDVYLDGARVLVIPQQHVVADAEVLIRFNAFQLEHLQVSWLELRSVGLIPHALAENDGVGSEALRVRATVLVNRRERIAYVDSRLETRPVILVVGVFGSFLCPVEVVVDEDAFAVERSCGDAIVSVLELFELFFSTLAAVGILASAYC